MIDLTLIAITISAVILVAVVILRGDAKGFDLATLLVKLALLALAGLLIYWGIAPDSLNAVGL